MEIILNEFVRAEKLVENIKSKGGYFPLGKERERERERERES